ncbi:coiled-coil domain-containing protein 22 isoform X5 [Mobula birostris]|uniref:coiled-coil domain-containing protein 22 isoform X5 n=1 Tax=Mobula birostris TaxID=1983395 RepID=UPI003B27E34A
MEEVDRILVRALADVGTEIPDDACSLGQFSTEMIVEGVVRCLQRIDPPSVNGLSHLLPPGMSARFRLGMSLAQACQGNPPCSNEPWQRGSGRSWPPLGSHPPSGPPDCWPLRAPERSRNSAVSRSASPESGRLGRISRQDYRARKCQRLQRRVQEQFQRCVQHGPGAASHSTSDLAQLLQSFGTGLAGTEMKGSRFTHTERFTFTQEAETAFRSMDAVRPSSKESEEGVRAQQEEEVKACEQQLEEVSLRLEEVSGDVKHLLVTVTQVREEVHQAEQAAAQKEELMGVKRRTLELLPDAETNLCKLQAVIEGSAQRIVKLAHQWEKHRAPLVSQLRELKEVHSNREHESTRKLEEIKALREKIKTSAEEAKRKEVLYRQLVTELGTLPKEVGRSAYTQRILEIVTNIKKQKEEICKILSDTKDSQKEVNSLSGKLERTFAVTDELVFKDAKKDEVVRKAYKYLAALHENCSHLIRTIEESGTILREVRDLEEQIESETGKMALGSLEKILADYKAVRQDNTALTLKLQQA